jgi:hypothetical protein
VRNVVVISVFVCDLVTDVKKSKPFVCVKFCTSAKKNLNNNNNNNNSKIQEERKI